MAQAEFDKAVAAIRALPPTGEVVPTNEQKLEFYGLYKQATVGDVEGSQPWAVQYEARAKYDAHKKHAGLSKEDAMKKYVEVAKAAGVKW